jgi:hypothetical protein
LGARLRCRDLTKIKFARQRECAGARHAEPKRTTVASCYGGGYNSGSLGRPARGAERCSAARPISATITRFDEANEPATPHSRGKG